MKRILIVDGDMAVRAQIGRYARLEGYDVAEASDGYTAVALFRQSTFDFVILAVIAAGGFGWVFRLPDDPSGFSPWSDLDPVRSGRRG